MFQSDDFKITSSHCFNKGQCLKRKSWSQTENTLCFKLLMTLISAHLLYFIKLLHFI